MKITYRIECIACTHPKSLHRQQLLLTNSNKEDLSSL